MNSRHVETAIAWFTLGGLVIYVPGETYVSWPQGLLHPYYLVDLIAMALLAWGAAHSLRARPQCASGLLCGAYGWAAANGWRATFWRLTELRAGGELEFGNSEAWVVGIASAIALALFAILLILTAISSRMRSL